MNQKRLFTDKGKAKYHNYFYLENAKRAEKEIKDGVLTELVPSGEVHPWKQ